MTPGRNESATDHPHDAKTLPNWTDSAVLIYGARKFGTTMLANLHDGGDELLFFPTEIKLKQFVNTPLLDGPTAAEFFYARSRLLGEQFLNFDSECYEAQVERLKARKVSNLRELLRHDIHAVYCSMTRRPEKPLMWGMKEVGGDTDRILQLFRSLFPDGRIVLVVRDTMRVARSVLLDRRRKGIRLSAREILSQVRAPVDVLHAQMQLLDDSSIHFTAYEWLTGGSLRREMEAICGYLGVAYTPVFEQTTIFGEPVVTRTASKPMRAVFRNRVSWRDGLSLREQLLVFIFSGWVRFQHILARRQLLSYAEVLRRIEMRRETDSSEPAQNAPSRS